MLEVRLIGGLLSEVPGSGYESSGHDPCRSTYYSMTLILLRDRVELEIDELRHVANEWEDLFHAVVHERHSGQEVDELPID